MRPGADIAAYEGLVFKTAELFASMVGLEREDMCQELRLKIVKALRAYDPARSSLTEGAYVYGCVANFVKDLKKAAARRAKSDARIGYIEDYAAHAAHDDGRLSRFEWRYMHVTEEEVYAEEFTMPSSVTQDERRIIALLTLGYDQREAAELLGVERATVEAAMRRVRGKLADWRPGSDPQHARPRATAA